MRLCVARDRGTPLKQAVLAAADVVWVDEGGGFCSSVFRSRHHRAVARLDVSIVNAPHEGRVLRWTMQHTMPGEPGLYVYEVRAASCDRPPSCPLMFA